MKRWLFTQWFPFLLLIFMLAACGTAPPAGPTATPGPAPDEALNPQNGPTATPLAPPAESPLPSSYPGSQPAPPQAPTNEPGYPPPPTFPPTVDPYPGGLVWIIRPVGTQCEEGTIEGYGDLSESVATLVAAGLQVESSEMTDIPVTANCGSPTSAHYRIQISYEGLDTALSMGWRQE